MVGDNENDQQPVKTGRSQAKMKILLGLLVLLAIPGGWLTYKVKSQRKAVEWVNDMSGDVIYDIELDDKGQFLQPDELAAQPNAWMLNFLGKDYVSGIGAVMIPEGAVNDLTPIANFKDLQEISIGNNQLSDLSLLSGMSRLRDINLEANPVVDLSPLAGLKNLNKVSLAKTKVMDLSPLKETGVQSLNLSDTGINDVAGISGAKLKQLNLNGTPIADLAPLAEMTGITHLYLSGTQVSDLSPLKNLVQIEQLNLGGSKVTDLSPLYGMTKLDGLTIWGTEIEQAQIDELKEKLPKVRVLAVKYKGGR